MVYAAKLRPRPFSRFDIFLPIFFSGYVCCNFYNLVWILFPKLSSFHRFMMTSYQHTVKSIREEKENKQPAHFTRLPETMVTRPDLFFDLFFDSANKDLSLLITLLASSHGPSEGLRFVSFFDKEYQKLWQPIEVRVSHDLDREGVVNVEWEDAPLAPFIESHRGSGKTDRKMRIEYTVEIAPASGVDVPIKNRMYQASRDLDCTMLPAAKAGEVNENDVEVTPLLMNGKAHMMQVCSDKFKYRESFYGVEIEKVKK